MNYRCLYICKMKLCGSVPISNDSLKNGDYGLLG